jgi:SAM-dependent methyltransferase
MDRKKKALQCIDVKKGRGLELGPLYSPVVTKDEANIFYVDHMSTEDLRKKYEGHPFSVDEIVEVDFVVGGSTLKESVQGKKFDYVVASHVIEHLPDVVGWLKDISSILKPGGILSLVIPDKRYSFDISRDVSRPSEIIGAYFDKLTKSTSAMIYDSAVEYREIAPSVGWSEEPWSYKEPTTYFKSEAIRRAQLNLRPDEYIDCHCYVFTPQSFFLIMKRLIEHDMCDFEVVNFSDTTKDELEFYVSLRKVDPKKDKKKQLASIPKLKRPLRVEELEKKVALLEKEIDAMKNSKSWRITKPVRAAKSKIKRR